MQKFFFGSTKLHTHSFFNLTKITRHYFYKTYKIFENVDGVSRTFSISSLKFPLKLASHYEKLQNMSQVFHPRWKTIDLRFLSVGSCRTSDLFLTCLCTIAELCLRTQVREFVYKCVLSLKKTREYNFSLRLMLIHLTKAFDSNLHRIYGVYYTSEVLRKV